jgi:hypothetical protein
LEPECQCQFKLAMPPTGCKTIDNVKIMMKMIVETLKQQLF